LRDFGVTDALSDPSLQIQDSSGHVIASNAGWNNSPIVSSTSAAVGAFRLTGGSQDAAMVLTLAPGLYTATVAGSSGPGTALVEVYDAAAGAAAADRHLVNISTRGFVESGGNLIVGFVVSGDAPKRVLVRAVGPGLSAFSVSNALADPKLELDTPAGAMVARNDDWGTPESIDASHPAASTADITTAEAAAGAFPLTAGSKDSATVATLSPGAYSAVVTGANNASGAVLVEVYELPNP
jgi:hypothetical protein